MKNFLRLGLTALVLPAAVTAASAQGTRGWEMGGVTSAMSYAPAGSDKSPSSGSMSVASVAARLTATQQVSPGTGQVITPAALSAVAQVMTGGSGAQASAGQLTTALATASGRQAGAAALVASLSALGGANMSNERMMVNAAVQAFNDFVRGVPDTFFQGGTAPQEFLAVHVALGMLAK